MDTKLTLKLNKSVIEKTKIYAHETNQSLSHLVENYFIQLTSQNNFKQTITPRVRKISGVLKGKNINYKEDISQYLQEKYITK